MSNKWLDIFYKKKYLGINIENDWNDFMESLKIKRKNAKKIVVYPGVINVAYYRVFVPFMELALNPNYDIRISTMLSSDDNDWADVMYFQRCADRLIIQEAERAKTAGVKVIFDTDDYMHNMQFNHPQKKDIENGRFLQDMDDLCKICDLTTVSTNYLKDAYEKRYRRRVEVLPNCFSMENWGYPKSGHLGGVNIGWAGSATHFDDLKEATPALTQLFEEHDQLRLVTVNYPGFEYTPYKDAFDGIPMDRRINFSGTQPNLIGNYMRFIDIGLAPLEINEFNRAKSNCKYLEYSLGRTPTIATEIEAYQGDTAILVKNRTINWYKAIEELLDEDVRISKGEEAYKWVMEKYDIKKNMEKWEMIL